MRVHEQELDAGAECRERPDRGLRARNDCERHEVLRVAREPLVARLELAVDVDADCRTL